MRKSDRNKEIWCSHVRNPQRRIPTKRSTTNTKLYDSRTFFLELNNDF